MLETLPGSEQSLGDFSHSYFFFFSLLFRSRTGCKWSLYIFQLGKLPHLSGVMLAPNSIPIWGVRVPWKILPSVLPLSRQTNCKIQPSRCSDCIGVLADGQIIISNFSKICTCFYIFTPPTMTQETHLSGNFSSLFDTFSAPGMFWSASVVKPQKLFLKFWYFGKILTTSLFTVNFFPLHIFITEIKFAKFTSTAGFFVLRWMVHFT